MFLEQGLLRLAEELLRSRTELLCSGSHVCRSGSDVCSDVRRSVCSELRRSGVLLRPAQQLLPPAALLQAAVPQSAMLQEPLPQELLRSRAELLCAGPDLRRPDGRADLCRSGCFLLPITSNV